MLLVESDGVRVFLFERLNADVGRVADDDVETAVDLARCRGREFSLAASLIDERKVAEERGRGLALQADFADREAKHPFGVEEGSKGVLVVRIPRGEFAG